MEFISFGGGLNSVAVYIEVWGERLFYQGSVH